ncbi:MAG TPA: AI-2E family transporter [Xanthobacteraceae bacterium]|nr:AI-2E family transporter [Xanthobacteraceae bacterium]
MNLQRQVWFWLGVLAAVITFIWLLHEILLPFVAGAALAYLLNPLANRIERLGVNRFMATFLMMAVFALAVVFFAIRIVPVLAVQIASLLENVPSYATRLQELAADPNWPWLNKVIGTSLADIQVSAYAKDAASAFLVFVTSVWSGGRAIVSLFSLLVITPVVAFYLLFDWQRIVATVDSWLPRKDADTIRMLAREMDTAIAGFIRGQTLICIILGTLYVIGFSVIGLNYGFLIGFATGLGSFVPYVGSFAGLLVALTVAVVQFWPSWLPVLAVLGVCLALQVVESYVLSPYLVGPSVGLHPVWLMFALFAFGYLFGLVGLIVAIPVSAAVGVLVRYAMRRYRESTLYTGCAR